MQIIKMSSITTTLILTILIQTTALGGKSDRFQTRSSSGVNKAYGQSGKQNEPSGRQDYMYKQWNEDLLLNQSENSISDNIDYQRVAFKSQRDYECGRAIANSKFRDSLQKDQSYKTSTGRTKYRPFEIRMPRIIGGDETLPGEFPWTVSVKLNDQPICGGSLIGTSWVLTAAHCVVGYNPKNLTVRLGAYRIKDMSETQTVTLSVDMFIVHQEYSIPRPFSNDIALLKMVEPVEFTDFIIPICLPTEDQISTSNSVLIVNDYSNKFTVDKTRSDESSGIVVSTKMSDLDIAKCFTKLEQNYLSSIGISSTNEATTIVPIETPEFPPSAYQTVNSYDKQEHSYYSLQWGKKDKTEQSVTPKSSYRPGAYREDSRGSMIKLSRLPISKELLHEIQSVGSTAMAELNLGLHQSDIEAIANDLAQGTRLVDNGHEVSANLAYGQDKNTVVAAEGSNKLSYGVGRNNLVRTTTEEEVDDPSKYSGLNGIVVGWGWVRELDGDDQVNNKGYPSVTLQKVKLPILKNNICESWFQSQSKKITLLPSQFCAGFNSGGKDACRGDSGGPMIMEDSSDTGRYKLIGIVSAGIGCARPSLPGLYTRVASFLPWINAQMLRYA